MPKPDNPGKPVDGTIVLNQTDVKLGDVVTFTSSIPDKVDPEFVYIQVIAYQGPTHLLVWGQTDVPAAEFKLGGEDSHWAQNGGPASCVADLFYWSKGGKYTVLASMEFEAAGLS